MKPFVRVSPFLILLGGFALRLYRLGANSLWYDETVSVYLAQSDLAELIRHTAGDIHPPLYYILLHYWGRLAGWSEFSVAFFSLWFGVLLIALVYRAAREWLNSRTVAILAAFFVAISPYNVWYSQEVRMYTLGAVLGLLSLLYLRRLLARGVLISRDFAAYVLVTAAGLYTLYYFLFLLVFQWLWVAYSLRRIAPGRMPNRLFSFLLSQLAIVILYLPWLSIAFRQATDPPVPPWREFIPLPRVVLETASALAFGQAVDPNLFGWIALLLIIPIAALVRREFKNESRAPDSNARFAIHDSRSAVFLLGYWLIPLAAIFLLSLWKPLYHVRYLFTYSPAFYLLAAYALVNLGREFAGAGKRAFGHRLRGLGALAAGTGIAFLLIAGYSLYNFWHNPAYAEDDLRGAVNYIAERWRPGDVMLVNAGYAYPALTYYFPQPLTRARLSAYPSSPPSGDPNSPLLLQTGSIDGAPTLGWGDPRSDFYATTADETRSALDRVLRDHPRVWMLRIYDTVVDPNGVIRAYLGAHTTLLDDQPFGGESQARVQGFLTQTLRVLPASAAPLNKNLGDRVQLAGVEIGLSDVQRGDYFDAVLYWKLLESVNNNYQVSLQLLDANGQNVAQHDETPLSDVLPMTRWNMDELYREPLRVKIPDTLPPGDYRAIVKLYDPRSAEVLGDVIDLGIVHVR